MKRFIRPPLPPGYEPAENQRVEAPAIYWRSGFKDWQPVSELGHWETDYRATFRAANGVYHFAVPSTSQNSAT